MDSRTFWTHWVIGIGAAIIWAWGDKLGVASSLQTYSAYTLPLLIGHAVGRSIDNRSADRPADPPSALPALEQAAAPEQAQTQGAST